jgi:bifunctional DNA-binding transcriptional regulator/antitoxin component of YhaV-PrlF toxin-antitoxin module
MSATVVRENRQLALPQEVVQAAGIKVDDQVDWRFEDGEIRGKKLAPETTEVLDLVDLDPKTLAPKEGKPIRESIIKAVRAAREAQR